MNIFTYFDGKIGDTPLQLVYINKNGAKVYAKYEWYNLFGSIKDRAALAMLKDAVSRDNNLLCRKNKILEYSGGNLAVSLAGICSRFGIRLTLVMPDGMPQSYLNLLKQYQFELIIVNSALGFLGVINRAKKIAKQDLTYHFLYQHKNNANLNCHRTTTAREIILQAQHSNLKSIDAFVASIGTGASLMGTYQGLIDNGHTPLLYASMPSEMPYGTFNIPSSVKKFAGSGGLGYGIRQPLVKSKDACIQHHFLYSIEQCYKQIIEFYEESGLIIGSSAAANLLAAKSITSQLSSHCNVITLFPSLATPEEIALFGIKS